MTSHLKFILVSWIIKPCIVAKRREELNAVRFALFAIHGEYNL